MEKYILAIDQGTTSSRAFLIDHNLNIAGTAQKEFKQYYPRPGWVEHDPDEIWDSVKHVVKSAVGESDIDPRAIKGIGITNQRETTIVWNKKTGRPIHNAIVWQDRRTADICRELIEEGKEDIFSKSAGLVIDSYFSGTKIKWMLENLPEAGKMAKEGELAFGTIDTYLTWMLTGGRRHVTDVSNASRTLLMNIDSCSWDDRLLTLLGVDRSLLPEIVDSSAIIGETSGTDILPDGIPIASMIGDQQAALFGQACFAKGRTKCTYGTGSFMLMNTGSKPIYSKERLLTSVGWRKGGQTTYVLEGATFIAGAAVQWLRDGLGIIKHASEIEALAGRVDSTDGVVFVPALVGLGAPYWRSDARGTITGISRGTTAAHIARATLEGIALQQVDLAAAMTRDSGIEIDELRVDGGGVQNNLLMQIQADLLGVKIVRPKQIETTVMGAALLAGLAVGLWKSEEEITTHWKEDKRFSSQMDEKSRNFHLSRWQAAINKA